MILAVLPVLLIGVSGFLPPEKEAHLSRIARAVVGEFPRQHLLHREIDDELSRQMLENYVSAFDYERIYFLASDIASFAQRQAGLGDTLRKGDLVLAGEIFETFKARVRDRLAFTEKLLAEEFDFTVDESYRWKRREAPWCADQAEWDELWRKRIKNEYLRRMIAQSLGEETATAETINPPVLEKLTTRIDVSETTFEPATNGVAETNPEPATNGAPETAGADKTGDAEEASKDDDLAVIEPDLPPAEFIRDRYNQFVQVIEDHDEEWVVQQYLAAFARSFDPHCDYMSPASAEDFAIEMKLSLVGIGALLRPEDGTARIVSLMPGGPADNDKSENRLRPGDKIIAVAQGDEPAVSILHWPLYRAVRVIRGEVGSRVVLTVIPAADPTGNTTKTVELIRDEVKLEAREAKSRVETHVRPDGSEMKVGVIVLPTFYADMGAKRYEPEYKSASRDVAAILRKLRDEKVDGIILDLRNNGGGSLVEAVLMTGLFIETGPVVLVKEKRNVNILPDNDPTIAYTGPLAVLVNRTSASASEIVAAALQDYGRAIVIGDSRTHGKGSVQTVLPLGRNEDMGSIKVTSALFYRISGGSTQLKGVEPDIVIPSPYDYMDFGEDSLENPLEWSTVRPVMFSPFDDLSPLLADLRARSGDRQAGDARYVAYRELLGRIETMNKDEQISLRLDERRERARTEKELLDVQNRLIEQAGEDPDDSETDLIEEEAIRILADLVRIRNPIVPAPAIDVPETVPAWESAQSAK
jgi:carboxyl-terminal processing protease